LPVISVEGAFKVHNLMGLQVKSVPVIRVQAVIDHAVTAAPAPRAADDVIELG
jgi:hypothetical protein